MKILIALFLVSCSNSSADIVPKIPDMACNEISTNINAKIFRCEDKYVMCYLSSGSVISLSCIKK